jgi:hypothetical protein
MYVCIYMSVSVLPLNNQPEMGLMRETTEDLRLFCVSRIFDFFVFQGRKTNNILALHTGFEK